MKRIQGLLVAAVALGLTAPSFVQAEPQDRPGGERSGGERQGGGRPDGARSGPPGGGSGGMRAAEPGRPTPSINRQGPGGGEGRPSPAMRPQAGHPATPAVNRGHMADAPVEGQPVQPHAGHRGASPRNIAPGGGADRRPATAAARAHAPPALAGWNRPSTPAERDKAGQGWRQAHRGWDSQTVWRRNQNWWHGDRAFRLYSGVRAGFFFIPELGYVTAPPGYERHYWPTGGALPQWYWRYTVGDYGRYGLPTPPNGCAWVWVDDDIALIDQSDGYILDVVRNVW